MNEFTFATPILSVKDFAASMDYYVNKLGFEKKWDWGTPANFGCVERGDVTMFLFEGAQGQPGTCVAIGMTNIDELFEEYKRSGAIIIEPPANRPWGSREMLVGDPDGHCFRMGSESCEPVDESQFNRT